MPTTTSNLNLAKPAGAEPYDINVINNNMDLVDAEFGAASGHAHTGTAGDGPQIPTAGVADLAVTTAKLASRAVTAAKLDANLFAFSQFLNSVQNGDFEAWSAGVSSAPDAWSLEGARASIARDGATVKRGAYSAAITNGAGNSADLHHDATSVAGGASFIDGRRYAAGAWVHAGAARRARLRIWDGVSSAYSSYHSGGGAWEWLTATATLSGSAAMVRVGLQIAAGSPITARLDGAVLAEGSLAPAFVAHPGDQHLKAVDHQTIGGANSIHGVLRAQFGRKRSIARGAVTITFPSAFRTVLEIFGTASNDGHGNKNVTFAALSTSGASLNAADSNGTKQAVDVSWMAIGVV